MVKWVIDTVYVTKKRYIVDSYVKEDALKKFSNQQPIEETYVDENVFDVRSINKYEYEKKYCNTKQLDWTKDK
jgi:hypothetical protein